MWTSHAISPNPLPWSDTSVTGADILAALQAQADPANALAVAAYHKVERVYLGLTVP